jgi:hypothetical protein
MWALVRMLFRSVNAEVFGKFGGFVDRQVKMTHFGGVIGVQG